MEDATRSNIGISKEQINAILEDEEYIDLQVELVAKIVKKFEERGYSRDQAIKLAAAMQG